MAKVHVALQKLLDDGVVEFVVSQGPPLHTTSTPPPDLDRRVEASWRVRRPPFGLGTKVFDDVTASTERMDRRATAGRSLLADAMLKHRRPRKVAAAAMSAKAKPPKVEPNTAAPALTAAKAETPPLPAKLDDVIYVVLDESGSMGHLIGTVNEQVAAIAKSLREKMPDASVVVIRFGSEVRVDAPISVAKFSHHAGAALGYTALRSALKRACSLASASGKSCLVYLLTDGDENNSGSDGADVADVVRMALATGRVTVACVGPKEAEVEFLHCGVDPSSIRRWDGVDAVDLAVATTQVTRGVEQYSAARKAGKTKLESFFVDADKLTLDTVAKACADVTASTWPTIVVKSCSIQEHVESKKVKFIFGAAYYPLTKPEKLKVGRAILVRHRDDATARVFKGPKLRELLGIPDEREVEVKPGGLGKWSLWVQSASPNRRLEPRSEVLIDRAHTGGTEATWTKPPEPKQ